MKNEVPKIKYTKMYKSQTQISHKKPITEGFMTVT
jgi:hypothetical protein